MPCLNTLNKVQKKKRLSISRTSRSCTVFSLCWPEYLAFWSTQVNSPLSIRSSYAEQLFLPNSIDFRLLPKRDSLKQSLHCQHQRHETTTARTYGQGQGSKSAQSCRPSGGLGGRRGSAPVPRAPICPKDHPLQDDKLSPP